MSDDINDFETLTPNHFVTGTANPNLLICPVKKTRRRCKQTKWEGCSSSTNVILAKMGTQIFTHHHDT